MTQEQDQSVPQTYPEERFPNARVHETAIIEDGVVLGEGTSVWHHAHIRHDARIGEECIIGGKSYIAYEVEIGNRVKINSSVYICFGVTIEDGVMVSAGTIFTNDRLPRATTPDLWQLRPSDPDEETLLTRVCQGATIGAGCTIGNDLTIGQFAMIGMGSLITKDVPDFHLVMGSPAKSVGVVCRCGRVLHRFNDSKRRGGDLKLNCDECGCRFKVNGQDVTELASAIYPGDTQTESGQNANPADPTTSGIAASVAASGIATGAANGKAPAASGDLRQKKNLKTIPDRAVASVSLDLDNQWSYMKTHGDDGWESFPSYLDVVVPRILDFFEARNQKITIFVVGQDAAIESNRPALKSLADAGHEIANHSFNHEPWLHLYSDQQLLEEFQKSEDAIFEATGQRTNGFRGPGFSFSDQVLNVMADRGYAYDCSTFPTFLGPVARAYYFFSSTLNRQQKKERKELFGKFSEGFRPNKPFNWKIGDQQLLEIPVTTMPFFKVPIHASYIFYLAQFSKTLAKMYFWKAMKLCWLTKTRPSLLLHPLDFMDVDDVPELKFFPAMKVSSDRKLELLDSCLDMMQKHWELVTMQQHATIAMDQPLAQRSVREHDIS